jgi:predicted dehydrogenase
VCELHPGSSWYATVESMCAAELPDIVSVVTPAKYMKAAVVTASKSPGIKAVQVDKPFGGPLADADAMVDACTAAGVLFAGGNLQRAMGEVQHAAARLRSGEWGSVVGASVHGWQGEILGGGCQHIAVLRLLTQAEVSSVVAWFDPVDGLTMEYDGEMVAVDNDESDPENGGVALRANAMLTLSTGVPCAVFGADTPCRGVDVWTDQDVLVRWDWAPPVVFQGIDVTTGRRVPLAIDYPEKEFAEFDYLADSIRSMLRTIAEP